MLFRRAISTVLNGFGTLAIIQSSCFYIVDLGSTTSQLVTKKKTSQINCRNEEMLLKFPVREKIAYFSAIMFLYYTGMTLSCP